ncbi:FAD-dependent oxidoreductase [Parasulfitobacter algicola]|uniref:FAD-binding protein n=1 Tax=Parasulfitobacter algicola TaxID=2614809 RepID=A0ABX2IPZ7_9RHOB|nr:FAD-dependent oxidoreductase [Sulfitobacter algicola]NSX54942.1 FAD-binding protein [Sulfitobacter algicola]
MTVQMIDVAAPPSGGFDLQTGTLIIGAGACGMVAALAAKEVGQNVLIIEADAIPAGSTALSAGLIPAAGTEIQRAAGIEDTPDLFASDIQSKAKNENPADLVAEMATQAGPTIDWLVNRYGLPFSLVADFDYPGHSRRRMHGLPTRSGAELINALRATCEDEDIDIICERRATELYHDGLMIKGIAVSVPDGTTETIACDKLILACNGFGGNRDMVAKYMPAIKDGLWFGHDGNRGEAVLWGEKLGAKLHHLGAYQGHGNVAHPHGILITWAVITEGGVQVNDKGERFWSEAQGYSEAAQAVLSQPGGQAFAIFDARIADIARQFEDFKQAEAVGAIHTADTLVKLASLLGLPATTLQKSIYGIPLGQRDEFGRHFGQTPLSPPYYGVRVTGALFHTQGGLMTDISGRVQHKSGRFFPNFFAGGGAACGVSGDADTGYLSGNGLLSAVVLGRNAGRA